MKIRNGFVSNSSSSSFVCDVCGREGSGWDMCLRDAEMSECVNGHTICNDELLEDILTIPTPEKCDNADVNEKGEPISCSETGTCEGCEEYAPEDENYDLPEGCCPICQWKVICEEDFSGYLLKEYKVSREEVFEVVKKENKRRKKLYNSEYVNYVCLKLNLNRDVLLLELSKKFGTYGAYLEYIG